MVSDFSLVMGLSPFLGGNYRVEKWVYYRSWSKWSIFGWIGKGEERYENLIG